MLNSVLHANRHLLKPLCGVLAAKLDLLNVGGLDRVWTVFKCVAMRGTGVVLVKPNDYTLVQFSWKCRKGSMPHFVRGAKFFRLCRSSGFPSLSLRWVSMDFRNVMHCN